NSTLLAIVEASPLPKEIAANTAPTTARANIATPRVTQSAVRLFFWACGTGAGICSGIAEAAGGGSRVACPFRGSAGGADEVWVCDTEAEVWGAAIDSGCP
ncbi:MAG: hypothetical protein KIT06_01705, partial [Cryobacterium sp.]|nr:hypothetical protein [Cryobacterium sp.]